MYKTGLVVEGGGLRGIYGSGVLDCFLDACLEFDYCVASSAGAANVASFLAKQKMRNHRFYTVYVKDKRYMSFGNWLKTGSFFGLEFIYDTLTNEIDPIDYDTMLSTKSIYQVTATNALTGRAEYLDLSYFQKNNCRALMASCAMPVLCKPIAMQGKLYYDGGLADPIPVKRALEDGCRQLVVVLSQPRGTQKKPEPYPWLYSRMLRKYPQVIAVMRKRHEIYNETLALIENLEREGRAVVIAPSSHIDLGFASKKEQELQQLYDLGVFDAGQVLQKI